VEASDLFKPFAALLVGGAISSLGPGFMVRRARFKARLMGLHGRAIASYTVISVLIAGTAIYWFFAQVREAAESGSTEFGSTLSYMFFGLAVGLPLSVPAVFSAWSTFKKESRAERRRRTKGATSDERLSYAEGLAKQIREVSPDRRMLTAGLSGDQGKVLLFDGPLERKEADRLVAAFRGELRDLGFKRVEGKGASGDWWSRV
jgi:hypothetical protein